MGSYDVRFWDTRKIGDNASGGRYRVRWAVNGQEHCKSFESVRKIVPGGDRNQCFRRSRGVA